MSTRFPASLVLAALTSIGIVVPIHAQTINTLPDQNAEAGTFGVGQNGGVTDTATFGQTVVAPRTSVLQDFTFSVDNFDTTPIVADAEVYAFDNATEKTVGPALFQSAPFTITPANALTLYTVAPNIVVGAGQNYVLLFTTSGLQAGQPDGRAAFGGVSPPTYLAGQGVFLGNGNDHSQILSSAFIPTSNFEFAFRADFAPVPEASTTISFGLLLALGGLAVAVKRKKVTA